MTPQHIAQLIIEYRYGILIPLAIIEGPVVAFVSAALAAIGYFNIYALVGVFFARDIGMDAIYYCTGYFGERTALARRMLKKLNLKGDPLDDLRAVWEEHPARTMFVGKLSYGIAQSFIIAAGMIKMNLRKFFSYGILVTVAQYGTLLALGYFFGNAFGGSASLIVENLQYVVAGATLILGTYYILSWYLRRRFPPGR